MPKWMHTVQLDPNFVSEWQAQDIAFHLAQQFCILQPGHAWQHQTFDCQANSSHSSLTYDAHPKVIANYSGDNQIVSRKSNGRMVTFSDVLSIRIGNEEQTAMHDFQVHVEAMESSAKPWSLHGEGQSKDAVLGSSIANHHKRHKDLHTNKDACVTPVDQSTHAMHRKQPFVQQTSDPCRDSMKAEESSSFDSARDHTLMSQCTLRTSNFEPWHARIRQFWPDTTVRQMGTPSWLCHSGESSRHPTSDNVQLASANHQPATGTLHTGHASVKPCTGNHSFVAMAPPEIQWNPLKWPYSFVTDVASDPPTTKGIVPKQDHTAHHTVRMTHSHATALAPHDKTFAVCLGVDVSDHSRFLAVLAKIQLHMDRFPSNAQKVQQEGPHVDNADEHISPSGTPCMPHQCPAHQTLQQQWIRSEDTGHQFTSKVCTDIPAYLPSHCVFNSDSPAQLSVQTRQARPPSDDLNKTVLMPQSQPHELVMHSLSPLARPLPPRSRKVTKDRRSCDLPTFHCRLEHESPIAAFAARLPEDAAQGNHEQHDHQPNVPVQPAFVDDLSTRLARMGYNVWDADFDIPVRTWYIDHATIRRWTAPRNLQLVGPPRGWEAQFSSLWVDQINPDEWFDVTVIYPD